MAFVFWYMKYCLNVSLLRMNLRFNFVGLNAAVDGVEGRRALILHRSQDLALPLHVCQIGVTIADLMSICQCITTSKIASKLSPTECQKKS